MVTIKVFGYVDAKGKASVKRAVVIAEDDNYIRGIDLARIPTEQHDRLFECLARHKIAKKVEFDNTSGYRLENFDPAWSKAFRTYKKENMD